MDCSLHIGRAFVRRQLIRRLGRGCIAAAMLIVASPLCADSSDVSVVFVEKTFNSLQTTTADPVAIVAPYRFSAGVQPSSTNSVTSANVTVPGASMATDLVLDSSGFFRFRSAFFATASELNAAYPNGDYLFNIETVTAPMTFTPTITFPTDAYPDASKILNTEWLAGALQFNPTQDFVCNWNTPATPADVGFSIQDPTGVTIFQTTLAAGTTSVTIPAGTLTAGIVYDARLDFDVVQSIFNGRARLEAVYRKRTNFSFNPVVDVPSITSPSSANATVSQFFIYQILGDTLASFSAQNLPKGVSYDPITGIAFGVPTTQGSAQATLSALNIAGEGFGGVNVKVQDPPAGAAFVNATSATGRVGNRFAFQLVTSGATAAKRFSASGLPAGLTCDAVSGIISGTPTDGGSSAVTLTLTDGSFTTTASLQLTFTADPVLPVITSPRRVALYPGQHFFYQLTATTANDGVDPPKFKYFGTLPSGLTFDPKTNTISGVFGGTPMRDGGPPDERFLNDTPLVQLAATNTHGTGTSPLVFFSAPTGAVNLSTRLAVGTGENVLIGGFIITGNAQKNVLLRGIGPSLKSNGTPLAGALQDPLLELHGGDGSFLKANDDWRSTQEQTVKNTGAPPLDDRESAIVATLQPSNFTAIVSGKNNTTGIALVELFDLGLAALQDTAATAKLAQISTRGAVQTGDNVLIGGFIIQGVVTKVLLRAIGPELTAKGVNGALSDTVLELHNASGATIAANDDWRTTQEQEIINTTVPPKDNRESALVATLNPGNYTAVVRGKSGATGVGLVEVYALQ
jgi:hypothetical protein